jgi:hypothetical protein
VQQAFAGAAGSVAEVAETAVAETAIGNTATVCYKNNCQGTSTNPIPRGQTWVNLGQASHKGCCAFKKGACDTCAPKTYNCYHYDKGKGQDDKWCQKAGAPYVYRAGQSPNNFPGCGWCECCEAVNPSYQCYHYEDGQDDKWCQMQGSPYVYAGYGTPNWGKVCGWCTCCIMQANPQSAEAIEAEMEAEIGENVVFNVQPDQNVSWVVGGFAVLGFVFTMYGAYKHYTKTEN